MAGLKRKPSVYLFIAKTVLVSVLLLLVAAILFPIFAKARECARCGVACSSNLKQLGLGFIQYVQDNDQKWPSGSGRWAGAIYSNEKSTGVYVCPEDSVQGTPASDPPTYRISYAMNANLVGKSQVTLSDPSRSALACDIAGTPLCDFRNNDTASQCTTGVTPNSAWGGIRLGTTSTTLCPTRHDPEITFVGCDGHVKSLRPERVSSGLDNPSGTGAQDATHAAGTKAVSAGSQYVMTFSER